MLDPCLVSLLLARDLLQQSDQLLWLGAAVEINKCIKTSRVGNLTYIVIEFMRLHHYNVVWCHFHGLLSPPPNPSACLGLVAIVIELWYNVQVLL